MAYFARLEMLCRREVRICMALARSLTDLAFALVRLAEVELAREDGNLNHTAELIASAGRSRQAAEEFLEDPACGAEPERADLESRVRQLSRAIHSADWHRRQAAASALRGLRLVDGRNGGIN